VKQHFFQKSVLREYDVRGTTGVTIGEADAYALGRSLATLTAGRGGKTIAIGRDGRLSSPALADAAIRGIVDAGLTALDVGLGPTPMLYYAVHHLNADSGLMITGSHNPPQDNGFKMTWHDGPIYGAAIQQLGQIAADGSWISGTGTAAPHDVAQAYVTRLLQDAPTQAVNAGWDPGHGAAAAVINALVACLPGQHHVINGTVDGTFPAHHPDPTVDANLVQLQSLVVERTLDIGLAFDGDGDRLGAVDAQGRIVRADQFLSVLAAELLTRKPGSAIIGDVKCTQTLFDRIAAQGGKPDMWKTGHSLIKARMKETGAELAGEMSGHIFIRDGYYGFDDGLYAAIRLLAALQRLNLTLADALDGLPVTWATPELRIDCPEEAKFKIVAALVADLKAEGVAKGITVSDIDGARVATPDGWWLIRASNTQAILAARAESTSPAGLERLKDIMGSRLAAYGLTLREGTGGH
jgi:phosphomannomutase